MRRMPKKKKYPQIIQFVIYPSLSLSTFSLQRYPLSQKSSLFLPPSSSTAAAPPPPPLSPPPPPPMAPSTALSPVAFKSSFSPLLFNPTRKPSSPSILLSPRGGVSRSRALFVVGRSCQRARARGGIFHGGILQSPIRLGWPRLRCRRGPPLCLAFVLSGGLLTLISADASWVAVLAVRVSLGVKREKKKFIKSQFS